MKPVKKFKMLLQIIFWCLLANADCKRKLNFRIAGGKVAKQGQFPFFVQIRIPRLYNFSHFAFMECGGSLFRPQLIITAGHCVSEALTPKGDLELKEYTQVYMGSNKRMQGVRNSITNVYLPSDYVGEFDSEGRVIELENDIAVARLRFPYSLGKDIQLVQLPKPHVKRCRTGVIIGAGLIENDSNIVDEHVLYTEIESKSVTELKQFVDRPEDDTIFYSEVKWMKGHALRGDSGGPYVCYQNGVAVLYGIVSTGLFTSYGTEISTYENIASHLEFLTAPRSGAVSVIFRIGWTILINLVMV